MFFLNSCIPAPLSLLAVFHPKVPLDEEYLGDGRWVILLYSMFQILPIIGETSKRNDGNDL